MNRQEIKSMAKEQIKGKIGIIFLINLIIVAIIIAANFTIGLIPFVGSLVVAIFINPAFVLSQTKVYLGLTQNKSPEAATSSGELDVMLMCFRVSPSFWCSHAAKSNAMPTVISVNSRFIICMLLFITKCHTKIQSISRFCNTTTTQLPPPTATMAQPLLHSRAWY